MAIQPTTKAIGQAIVSYLSQMNYSGTTISVYQLVQLEEIKDVLALLSQNGVCAEVYGDTGNSSPKAFGGGMWKEVRWRILSMCSLDTPTLAQQIYDVGDTFETLLGSHIQLGGNIDGVFFSQFVEGSGKHMRIERNAQFIRAYQVELLTRQQYQVTLTP